VFLSNRTEADFQTWRDERDWTARKYALWDAGKRLEPPSYGSGRPCSRFRRCPCGEVFDMHGPEAVLVHVTSRRSARIAARKATGWPFDAIVLPDGRARTIEGSNSDYVNLPNSVALERTVYALIRP
jgi:hypothetical protein